MKLKLNRVVYRLWHNRSAKGRVGYIGKDSYYPHRTSLIKRSKEKTCRALYRALKKYPLKFWRVEILASGFRKDNTLIKAEIFYIKKFDSKNKGYNLTDGGEGIVGFKFSDKSRKKMSESRKGWKISNETRIRMSKSLMGNKHLLGHKHSKEARDKMSKALIGNKRALGLKHTAETRAKMSEAHKGFKFSAEARAKMSAAQVGNKKGKANKGKKHSAEWSANVSKGFKRRRERLKAAQAKLNGGRKEGTNSGRGSGSAPHLASN
jgi:group I intron endonuclease